VRDSSARADHHRKEAARYHELARLASPAYLGDFYRRIAVRYISMAEELSREAGRRCQVGSNQGGVDSEGYKMRMLERPQTSVDSLEAEIAGQVKEKPQRVRKFAQPCQNGFPGRQLVDQPRKDQDIIARK
jgi:hypothetical protein